MGALLSLSRPAAVWAWDISVFVTFAFGALFLFGWLSEEFAQSAKWKKRKRLFITLAIIGVIGEQTGTLAEFAFSEHLQTIDEKAIAGLTMRAANAERDAAGAIKEARQAESHLAEANKAAAEANEKAEQFRLAIADAKKRASEADAKAEADHLARVQIERKMAWRHLTEKQRANLAQLFAPLSGHNVMISAQSSDPEASGFAHEIADTLKSAGVKVDERFGVIFPEGGNLPLGIAIEVTPDEISEREGGVLQGALQSEGLSAPGLLLRPPQGNSPPPPRTVEIFVGARPE